MASWTSDILHIIDSFQHSEDLEQFADCWGLRDDSYIQQKLLDLKWQELQFEIGFQRDQDGCPASKQPRTQYGGGPGAEPQKPIEFSLHKVGEKQFKRSLAIDRQYKVQVKNNPVENAKLQDIHDELHSLFDRALQDVKTNMEDADLGRVVVNHPDLQNPIIVAMRPLEELNAQAIMEVIENVLTSNEELTMTSGFDIDIGTIKVPKGGAHLRITSLQGENNSLMRKSSIGFIDNKDNLCLPRSIAYAWAKLNTVSQDEWLQLTEHSNLSTLDNILLHRKVPKHFYNHLKMKKRHEQRKLAEALCRLADVPTDRQGTIQDIEKFERLLTVGIYCVSSKLGNKFLHVPKEQTPQHQKLFIYLIENDSEQHFHSILSITGFFSTSYFCTSCLVPYNDRRRHTCSQICLTCKEACEVTDDQMSCRTCHMVCRSKECFQRHQQDKTSKYGNKSVSIKSQCQTYWKCTTCKHVVKLDQERTPESHRCGEYLCPMCKQQVMPGHLCYQRAKEPKLSYPKFIFFDMETTQDNVIVCDCDNPQNHTGVCLRGKQEHKVNLVVCQSACTKCLRDPVSKNTVCDKCGSRCDKCATWDEDKNTFAKPPCYNTCGFRQKHFFGETAAVDFCKWLFTSQHANFTCISHNGQGFDHFPILKYVIDQSIRPKTIFNGNKLIYMEVTKSLNIRFVDSLNFLPMKLAKLPECFGLTELKKGYFPHFFNVKDNQEYKGSYPDPHYYGVDSMSNSDRNTFLKWHTSKINSNATFDFHTELLDYCVSDVDILRQACLKFWSLVKETTGEWEWVPNKHGVPKQKRVRSIDPFQQVTIASVCSDIFRKKFLEEEWQVTLRSKQGLITNWLPAKKRNDQLVVFYNDVWMNNDDMKKNDITIENSQFVRSPIAFVPTNGYVSHDQYSKKSIQYLEWIMETHRRKGTPIYIQHALNTGEKTIPGTKYKLDGFCQDTNTAYEFHGCLYHGCWFCHKTNREGTILPTTKQSVAELYALTMKKKQYLEQHGYTYVSIWECKFDKMVSTSADMQTFVTSLDFQERLNPRDSFYGGRTEAICLHKEVDQITEKIKYVDFTSLYPYCNKYSKYPLYHPQIITEGFDTIDNYFGIAKVKVLPPQQLYIPVLPVRSNGKLKFTLCRTCADTEKTTPCECTEDQRSIIGTYCTPELMTALEHGYRVIKIYEVYHFPESTQYNPDTREGGLFTNYINTFLKIKQESSGYPEWVKTTDDRKQYIQNYMSNEGIQLHEMNIQQNPGLRSLAKLCLNSMWGKWGQRSGLTSSTFLHDSEADAFFRLLTDTTIHVKNFHIITDDIIHMEWEPKDGFVPDGNSNIFLACFTTAYARIKLFDMVSKLGRRVLYMDTDSCVYVSEQGCDEPSLGDYLGQLTNELKPGETCIREFVTAGAKNYSYVTNTGRQVCKVRGFSLNYATSKLINFQVIKNLVIQTTTQRATGTADTNTCTTTRQMKRKRKHTDSEQDVTEQCEPYVITTCNKICRDKRKRILYNRLEHKRYRMVFSKRVIQSDLTTLPYGYKQNIVSAS